MDEPIFLALGSNLGDRVDNLCIAKAFLLPDVILLQESPIYETPPWGFEAQPAFLNQVVEVRSTLTPVELLSYLKDIEASMGRQQTFRNGPRLIDLDILFYGSSVVDESKLQIPHPRLHQRAFVLVPLNDIAPDYVHPILNQTVADLLSKLDQEGIHPL